MNLLQNAAEAIKVNGTVSIRTFEKDGNVHIQIIDTGKGISRKRRERLFDPAFSKKGSRMKAGLGLFTSANIIRRHSGRLEVESEVGKGSTFTIVLPIQTIQADGVEPAKQADRCDRLEKKSRNLDE